MSDIAQTPEPPYYAVIFTSVRTSGDHGYGIHINGNRYSYSSGTDCQSLSLRHFSR
jgi:hypothetical protein